MIEKTQDHLAAIAAETEAAQRVGGCQAKHQSARTGYDNATAERGRLLAASARGEDIRPVQLTKADDASREARAVLDLAEAVMAEAQKQHHEAGKTLRPLHNEWVHGAHTALKQQRREMALQVDEMIRQANAKIDEINGLLAEHNALPDFIDVAIRQNGTPPQVKGRVAMLHGGFNEGAATTTAANAAAC
ncbi:MAG: hypothetical protein KGH75_09745 [Rhodospirillales bacterium]|nr:hypothetical protein [Rhodospirillales bacterium]